MKSRSYISSKSVLKTMTLPVSWPPRDTIRDTEKDRWLSHTLAPEASEKNKIFNTCASCFALSTNESDEDDFDYGASLIEPTNVIHCTKQVHQPQHNHGRTDHGLKQINHGSTTDHFFTFQQLRGLQKSLRHSGTPQRMEGLKAARHRRTCSHSQSSMTSNEHQCTPTSNANTSTSARNQAGRPTQRAPVQLTLEIHQQTTI